MRRFDDPEDRDEPPEDLTDWLAMGMRRVEAKAWRRWNFTLEQARQWLAAGVRDALTAAQWQTAGVVPAKVKDWVAANISPSEAIHWNEFGFKLDEAKEHKRNGRSPTDAHDQQISARTQRTVSFSGFGRMGAMGDQMQKFMNAGVPHTVMSGYLVTQWIDEEALSWAQRGIHAHDAKMWQAIGLTPAEAGELSKKDITPGDAIRDWWRAGIPFDEVADWIGAGLSPEEAVEQRAAGTTVEQAAAMRALRRGSL